MSRSRYGSQPEARRMSATWDLSAGMDRYRWPSKDPGRGCADERHLAPLTQVAGTTRRRSFPREKRSEPRGRDLAWSSYGSSKLPTQIEAADNLKRQRDRHQRTDAWLQRRSAFARSADS